jgi:hypothetical protein
MRTVPLILLPPEKQKNGAARCYSMKITFHVPRFGENLFADAEGEESILLAVS